MLRGRPGEGQRSARGIAAASTLRNWLGMWSLLLNAEADTVFFPSDAQRIFDALAATDKAQASIDSDHYFTTPEARGEQADLIAKWIAKRWR